MEKIAGKPVVDVATTAIPRLMIRDNIGGFLRAMSDRGDYHLRWLFHLDQYPGLESDWDASMTQAVRVSALFDDARLFASRTNVGFGAAVCRLMSEVQRGVLWIEDDWDWHGGFRLSDVLEAVEKEGASSFNFCKVGGQIGGLHPTYWSHKMVSHLLKNWPGDEGFTDAKSKRIIRFARRFKYAAAPHIRRSWKKGGCGKEEKEPPEGLLCRHLGSEHMAKRGFTHSHTGSRLTRGKQ